MHLQGQLVTARQPAGTPTGGQFATVGRAETGTRLEWDVYVLVHPERFPSNDWDVDDEEYGAAVLDAADGARRIAVLDSAQIDDIDDDPELTVNVPVDGWQVQQFDPHELDRAAAVIAAQVAPGERVAVGGYSRTDCVRRTVEGLRAAGVDAFIDEPTALPYPDDSVYEHAHEDHGAWE